jgi:hypothetical protein
MTRHAALWLQTIVASVVVLFASATAAHAGGTFDNFRNICVETHADQARALAVADKQGWTPMPQTMIDSIPLGNALEQAAGRFRTSASGSYFLIVAKGHNPNVTNALRVAVCIVGAAPPDTSTMDDAAKFAAVPGDPSLCQQTETDTCYAWRDKDGVHEPLEVQALSSATSGFALLTSSVQPKISMICLSMPIDDGATP